MTDGPRDLLAVGLGLLLLNMLALGVLMLLRGPSLPLVLLAVGTVGMGVAKLGRASLGTKGEA